MVEQTKREFTKREFLCDGPRCRPRISVDMEQVYRDLDSKMSLAAVAKKHQVSVATLRRRHKEYQESIEIMEKEEKEKAESETGYKLPPLPPGL